LNFYRRMLVVRRENPALISGEYQVLNAEAEDYLAFLRTSDEQRLLVILNMSAERQQISVDLPEDELRLVFSNRERGDIEQAGGFELAPFEVYIAEF
jgi:glycosidase